MKKKIYKKIDEIVYYTKLPNKMKVYLLYKPGFVEKNAYIVTKFGHFDSIRNIKVNGKKMQIPLGSAHFLEHRMFSLNGKDASDLFASYGASCNAYTTYEKTAYYFTCQSNFYECLRVLLDMMDSFTSTQEQIDVEKSIILQEARMYDESPSHVLNKAIYESSYINHPIKYDIIGTEKTIQETNKDVLEAIFNTFYDPSNLTLVVCGDIDHMELEHYLLDNLLKTKNNKLIPKLKISDPHLVKNDYKEIYLSTIKLPRFGLLFKLPAEVNKYKKDRMYFCYNLILEHYFSSSGVYAEKWLKEGIISSLLEYSVCSNIDLDCIIFYNISNNIECIVSNIKKLFDGNKALDITQQAFDDLKKSHYGYALKSYETVSGLCSYFVYDLFTSSKDFFLEIEEVKSLTLEDMIMAYNNICLAVKSLVVLRGEK